MAPSSSENIETSRPGTPIALVQDVDERFACGAWLAMTMSSPRSSSGSEGEVLSSRDRLLEAAIEIAGREGLDAVTYRSVAGRAGVAHGLVRHHFGSREQLLIEAFRRAASQDSDEAMLEASSIDEFASTFVKTLNATGPRQVLQFDEVTQGIRGNLPLDNIRSLYDRYMANVHQTLDNVGVDDADDLMSGLVFAALDGLVLQHFVYRDDARTEGMLRELRGVLRRAPRSSS